MIANVLGEAFSNEEAARGFTIIGVIASILYLAIAVEAVKAKRDRLRPTWPLFAAVVIIFVAAGTSLRQTPSAPQKDAPKQSVAQESPQGKWQVQTGRSQMDDSRSVVLALEANEEVQGWLQKAKPVLFIRCKEQKTNVYVDTGLSVNPEYQPCDEYGCRDTYSVRLRLDDAKTSSEGWGLSTDDKALFCRKDNVAFARQLASGKKLSFEFTPFSAPKSVVTFDLRGLDTLLPDVAKACNWSTKVRKVSSE